MKTGEGHSIYFLGIGGIGMSALARYFHSLGYAIAGYDLTPSPLTKQLENEGMAIHYEDNPNLLPALIEIVIYTPAIPSTSKELAEIKRRGLPMMKRAQALGEISKGKYTIAVAGTHGKTTTTAMTAHILCECGKDTTAFIGGIANNFDSNLHLGKTAESLLVAEADEFDRSFLQLHPNISIVNSIDADHLDIYGDKEHLIKSFNDFVALTEDAVIYREGLPINDCKHGICFGFSHDCNFYADEIVSSEGTTSFTIHGNGETTRITIAMAGLHNVMNATAAYIAARQIGIEGVDIAKALASFKGVRRRFDIRINSKKHCYIDDYAHHPEEIKSCLSAIRASFPKRKITLVFQPHLFTRTRDFMEEFANTLAMADELILLDIYPARELPIEGITSQALLEKVNLQAKTVCPKEDLMALIESKRPELLVTMGAGNIDRFVEPLEKMIATW